MDISYGQTQQTSARQEHTLAAHQFQGLDLLAATALELEAKIVAEQETNPVLEVELPDGNEGAVNDPFEEYYGGTTGDERAEDYNEDRDGFNETLEHYTERGEDFFSGGNDPDMDERRQHFFDSITTEISLQEQLLEQLRFSDCPDRLKTAAEEIIGNIGDNGFFESALSEVAQSCLCSVEDAQEALTLIQSFDPPGIGARDLKECLLLQIARDPGKYDPRLQELIADHLDDVGKNRLPQVAKAMNISMDELQELRAELKTLSPHPVSNIASGRIDYVRPEVTVFRDEDGEYRVRSEKDLIPRLTLNPAYLEMLEDPDTPEDAKSYIREKVNAAKLLMRSLEQRTGTIERIAELIVAGQHDFFENGMESLLPMTMRELAEKINRDESTVSRAIANKYMRTPRGLVPFRTFFTTSGFTGDNGNEVSSHGIKEIIRAAVDGEDPASPLSDQDISLLLKEKGFAVARRTVAKYREELGIASSQGRKVYR